MAGNDANTLLLVHCDGADTSTTFTDVSVGGETHTMTATLDAQVDTSQKVFGTSSLLVDGSVDEWLTTGDSVDWDFGTGDFTIDFWLRSDNGDWSRFFELGNFDGQGIALQHNGSTLFVYVNNTELTGAHTLVADTWYHVAAVRSSGTVKVYMDGVEEVTGTASADITGVSQGVFFGAWQSADRELVGWMDELRISNIARWTTGFTPPIAPYTKDRTYMMIT